MSNDTLRTNTAGAKDHNSTDARELEDWLRSVNRSSRFRMRADAIANAGPVGRGFTLVRRFRLKGTEVGYVTAFALGSRAALRFVVARGRRS